MNARRYEIADDDLSRQRRKRDDRLLATTLPDDPAVTVGDVVADVLAASGADAPGPPSGFDVRSYLAAQGHDRPTIETVVDYLDRQAALPVPQYRAARPRPLP